MQATVNKRGKIQVGGAIGMSPFASDMAIVLKDIDLIPLQGWAGDRLNALVTRGDLSFKGRVKAEGTPISVAVKGDARLTNFNLLDRENAADLLSWRSFDVGGINVTTAPLKVDVTTVSLSDFLQKLFCPRQEGSTSRTFLSMMRRLISQSLTLHLPLRP